MALNSVRLRALAIVAACLTACSAPPAPPAPTPTAIPAVAPLPVATPVPPGAPTSATPPRPDPTIAPDLNPDQRAMLAAARLSLVEADYPTAIQQWRALLALTPEARIQLALAQALNSQGADALGTLSQGARDPRDNYVRGLALDATGQHDQAMQSLADYAAANPPVAASVHLEIAERELNQHRARESADAAQKGLDTAQARQLKRRLLEVRAQALAGLGDNEAAFDAHRQVLALATSNGTLGEQLFQLAQASRDLGRPDAAIQALKTALDQFPSASTTADALRLLDELGAADQIDPFVLGRARYFAVDYRNAVTAFDAYLKDDPNGPDASSARLYRALASLTPGNEPNALRDLDAIADDPDQDSELAAQALLEAGQALEGLSEPDQAETRYQKLLDKFPRLDAATTAGFRLGLVRWVRGADAAAVAAWDQLLTRRDDLTPDDVSRALFWRGKALARQGRDADARVSWSDAAAVRPSTYYSFLAAARSGAAATASASSTITADDERALAQWLAARNQDLTAATSLVAADPALARASLDASIGLFREGNWEADELLTRYPDRPDRLYPLARRFADLGLVGGATRLGQAAYAAASIQDPHDAPAALLKVANPRPFANLTDGAATRYGLDPLLLEATIATGSQFDAYATDAATGQSGLAKMTPVHVDEASHALHTSALDEVQPKLAIEHAAWLLADRLRRYTARPEIALSAIATTDRLVDGWAVRNGADDPDAYIELIDYEGVRAGLRSVLAARLTYAMAYAAPGSPPGLKPEPTAAWIKIARLAGDLPPDAPLSSPLGGEAARATTLQRDGDYPGAIDAFTALTSDPNLAADARLRLGESLLAAGRPAEALDVLQQSNATPADFLIGRALADLGRCADALGYFMRFAATAEPALAAQSLVAQADCQQDLGHASDAVPLLEQAAATPELPRLQSLDLRERLALVRVRAGDLDGARADYAGLLGIARSSSYRAELNYYLGLLATDPATAADRFRGAVQLDPKSRGAQTALDELVAIGDPFAMSFEAGDARFAQNRYREAFTAYSAFLDQNPSDPRAAKALYGRGVSLVRLGQDRAGIAVLESIADRFPGTPDAADGVFRGGRIRESLADLDGAAAAYRRVMAMPGAGSRATDAQFRLAFVLFQQGNFAAARDGWNDLTGRVAAPDDRAQAFFWLGKALRAAGDSTGAQSAWTSAQRADPRGFYGLRAGDLLAGAPVPRAAAAPSLARVQRYADDPFGAMRDWVATRGDPSAAQARLNADPGLARADTLLAMGLRQPAIWELQAVASRLGNDANAVALLGAWEQQRGLYNPALLLAYDVAPMANVSLLSGPTALRRLAYPLPHPAVLGEAATQLHVDPLLFSALMLQESLMDQSVESSAQARGLAQLIAATGYDAARALGQYDFRTPDLFKPDVSITLGAFTIGERLSRYGQRIFPAVAAYNAPEFAVDGWLLAAGEADIDTFAEAIPFTETYPYVQKIYENYREYLELYP